MSENEKNPLDIINDPANRISAQKAYSSDEENEANTNKNEEEAKKDISRRNFLKFGGAAAAVASVAASGAAGFATGRSAEGYTGWGNTQQGNDMFFNREPFRVDVAEMMEPVGEVTRPDWHEQLLLMWQFVMEMLVKKEWNPAMGVEAMPGEVGDYYRANPERYKSLAHRLATFMKAQEYWFGGAYKRYAIAEAYEMAFGLGLAPNSNLPEEPDFAYKTTGVEQPPEKWDFRHINPKKEKMEFKSPAHASKLIKQIAHQFGASVVGICKFDERFMVKNTMRGMKDWGRNWGDKVPSHWKSVIIFGTPMNWDGVLSAIAYSTSTDAYYRSRSVAGLLENFIQSLGHPARAQYPAQGYEIMISPYTMLAGLAEYSRAGLVMFPELGSNVRPAAVITDIEFEYDKPINIGMAKFCEKCKICAETCPSGAITFDDKPQTIVRGFKRWLLDEEKCHLQWVAGATPRGSGCRVCIAVCPYTRKNTWIHTISRELEARDSTGAVATGLLAMQQNFFKYPAGEEFRSNWDGGREATYHDPAWWYRSEDFFDNVEKDWIYNGMH